MWTFAVLALAAAAAPTPPTPQEPSPAESLAIGRYLAIHHCGACHSVGPHGDSPNPAAPPFRHLNRRMDVDSLGEGLAQGLLTHHPAMPAFHLAPREVVGVVRYLRSVQVERTPPPRESPRP